MVAIKISGHGSCNHHPRPPFSGQAIRMPIGRSPLLALSPFFRSSVPWRTVLQGVGKLAQRSYESIELLPAPVLEDHMPHPLARSVDAVRHGLSLRGDDGFAHAAIKGAFPAPHQPLAFKLGNLPADRGVVAS